MINFSSRKRIIPGTTARNRQASKKTSMKRHHPEPKKNNNFTKWGKRPVPVPVPLFVKLEGMKLEEIIEETKETNVEVGKGPVPVPPFVKLEEIIEETKETNVEDFVKELKLKVTDVEVFGRDYSYIVVYPDGRTLSVHVFDDEDSDEEPDDAPGRTVEEVTEGIYEALRAAM